MRVEAPVFAFEPTKPKTTQPARSAKFETVLAERVAPQRNEAASAPAALDASSEVEAEEPAQDNELGDMVDDQQSQQAQGDEAGEQSEQEDANFSAELIDEMTLEELEFASGEDLLVQDNDLLEAQALATPLAVAIPLEALTEAGTLQRTEAPLANTWSQAFSAHPVEADVVNPEAALLSGEEQSSQLVATAELSGGSVRLPEGMVAIQPELLAPLDLAKPQAMERLQDLVEFQIRASKSPNGAKQLSLTLNPEGLGRLRILAQTDGDKMRVMLKVEQGDAARLIERVLPHLEAQIAASVAMPVEFELVQEEILGNDAGLQLGEFADQEGDSDQADSGEEGDLVDQWNKHLEEPVLDLGQTLHVVA